MEFVSRFLLQTKKRVYVEEMSYAFYNNTEGNLKYIAILAPSI